MMLPFISCSAKLPVFVLLISAFIPAYLQWLSLILIYIFWILMWILSNFILSKFLKYTKNNFKFNLPKYKIPDLKFILKKIYEVLKDFLTKITVFILPFSIILTLLFTFPNEDKIEETYWAKIWQTIWIIFEPIWFNEKMSISVISGLVGKEIIVSTLWSLYYLDNSDDTNRLVKKIQNDETINFATAMSYLIFILLYTACMWAVFTARIELWNKWWAVFFVYPIIFAWIISFIVYNSLKLFS
jgi:ferrous iron transport protein B